MGNKQPNHIETFQKNTAITPLPQGPIINYTDHELLCIENDGPSICIFNTLKKNWSSLIKCRSDGSIRFGENITFDPDRNILYILDETQINLINMETHKQNRRNISSYITSRCSIIGTKQAIHIIGGSGNKHYIFDKASNTIKLVHTFDEFSAMLQIGLIYFKSYDMIILIGGSDNGQPIHCHTFNVKTETWKKYDDIQFPYYGGDALLTKDERHIIMIPRKDMDNINVEDIYILDVNNRNDFKLRKSKYKFKLMKDRQFAVRKFCLSGGESKDLLIHGFLKDDEYDYSDLPMDIMGVIFKFCDFERLNFFVFSAKGSYQNDPGYMKYRVIDVVDVLNSE